MTTRSAAFVLALVLLWHAGAVQAGPYGPAIAASQHLWAFAIHPREPLMLLQIGDNTHYDLYLSRRDRRGRWSRPTLWPLHRPGSDDSDPFFSPDGRQLFFARRVDAQAKHHDLWVVDFASGRWGEPRPLGETVNTELDEYLPSVASNGDLFFERGGSGQGFDLFVARLTPQGYTQAERLPAPVNSEANEESPFISPDGHSLLFVRGAGMWHSELTSSGWSEPRPMRLRRPGPLIYSPYVSPDGRWLYYTTTASGKARLEREPYAAARP